MIDHTQFKTHTVAFYTLGCKLNFSETSTIARHLQEEGYKRVPFNDAADIYVINTCSVTDTADKKCRYVIHKALRTNPRAFIVVTGCFAQLKPHSLMNMKGVNLVLGSNEKFDLKNHLDNLEKKSGGRSICRQHCQRQAIYALLLLGRPHTHLLKGSGWM